MFEYDEEHATYIASSIVASHSERQFGRPVFTGSSAESYLEELHAEQRADGARSTIVLLATVLAADIFEHVPSAHSWRAQRPSVEAAACPAAKRDAVTAIEPATDREEPDPLVNFLLGEATDRLTEGDVRLGRTRSNVRSLGRDKWSTGLAGGYVRYREGQAIAESVPAVMDLVDST